MRQGVAVTGDRFILGLQNAPKAEPHSTVITLGTFDGIHLGHQAIFRRVREIAQADKLQPILVTFHPHPRVVVTPDKIPMLLTTIEEKEQFVPHFFDGTTVVVEFNEQVKNLTAEEFVKQVLVDHLGVRRLVVGYDHALGKDRSGDIPELTRLGSEWGFDVEVVAPVIYDDKKVSSSRIREALSAGEFEMALRLLGHDYAIAGKVERGIGLGRKIGYPTANVSYNQRKLLPGQGVYACWVQVGREEFDGMMFIGQNHFNPEERLTVEANIFDFDRDIYDQNIIVHPTHFIRENRKYDSTDELVAQIERDKQRVLEIFRKGEKTCR
ncbi:bifunctional riboflavin kinase/FAD synthetase [candidate division GN15 bacterium]|nr:bifunctional riboflavin kinase/FAD synthetase [candidate division GN15 bacterium]